MDGEKIKNDVIDITPTWKELLPVLLVVYRDGETAKARKDIEAELVRMAEAADAYNTLVKDLPERIKREREEAIREYLQDRNRA